MLGYDTEENLVARECTTCKEYLPVKDFGKNVTFTGGYNCECKACFSVSRKVAQRKRQLPKIEKIKLDNDGNVLGRVCSKCKTYKDRQFFGVQTHKANKYGIGSSCKNCQKTDREIRISSGKARNAYLKHTYGINNEIYDSMSKNQEGVCSVCKGTATERFTKNKGTLVVDHCHSTSKVRALLCSTCNINVGILETTYTRESLTSLFAYVEMCNKIKEDNHE